VELCSPNKPHFSVDVNVPKDEKLEGERGGRKTGGKAWLPWCNLTSVKLKNKAANRSFQPALISLVPVRAFDSCNPSVAYQEEGTEPMTIPRKKTFNEDRVPPIYTDQSRPRYTWMQGLPDQLGYLLGELSLSLSELDVPVDLLTRVSSLATSASSLPVRRHLSGSRSVRSSLIEQI
jgi:hypothetical protein